MWLVALLTIIFHSNFRSVDTLADSAGVVLLPLPSAPTPEFSGPIQNVTAAVGREAVLTCTVTELGHYKVGWMKADDQTILSLHTRVITHNPRISVTHDDNFRTWQLRIRQLKESDRGCYMCQINTSSMRKQLGCIDVQVSPDIDDTETSADFTVTEGENVTLVCKATGHPQPRILWRREDGDKLILHTGTHQTEKADTFSGSQLLLLRVERHQMGAYLCIASNDVPPTVSKRIMLNINFAPKLHVPRGLVGAPLNADAKLKCEVEAYPHSNNYWLKNGEDVLKSGYRYKIQEKRTGYKTTMIITIFNISHYDFGTYKCSASNSLGQSDDTVRLYEVKIPTTTVTTITTKVFYMPVRVTTRKIHPAVNETSIMFKSAIVTTGKLTVLITFVYFLVAWCILFILTQCIKWLLKDKTKVLKIISEITTFQHTPTPSLSTSSSTIDLERSLKEDPSEDWLFPPSVVPAPLEFETHSSATSLSACTIAFFAFVVITFR